MRKFKTVDSLTVKNSCQTYGQNPMNSGRAWVNLNEPYVQSTPEVSPAPDCLHFNRISQGSLALARKSGP